jgi:hypothetical protein
LSRTAPGKTIRRPQFRLILRPHNRFDAVRNLPFAGGPVLLKTLNRHLDIHPPNGYVRFMMRINRLSIVLKITLLAASLAAGSARAEEPKLIAEHGNWKTYAFSEKGAKTCYALARPDKSRPTNVKRDPIYLLVTNKQKPRVANEISVIIGYPFKKSSKATAAIGSDKFSMYTEKDGAWIDGAALQKRMISAMKRGATLIVKGTSWRGTLTTDEYSLKGVTAALEEIDKACKK